MTFYQRHIAPRLTHLAMRQNNLVRYRKRVIDAAEGRVLKSGPAQG